MADTIVLRVLRKIIDSARFVAAIIFLAIYILGLHFPVIAAHAGEWTLAITTLALMLIHGYSQRDAGAAAAGALPADWENAVSDVVLEIINDLFDETHPHGTTPLDEGGKAAQP